MITFLVLPVATNLATSVLPAAVQPYVWLAWPVACVSAVVAAVVEARRQRPSKPVADSEDDERARIRHAADELAATLHDQWSAEADLRKLHRPQPLHLRWSSTNRPVSAHPANVLGDAAVGGRPLRLRLHGEAHEIATAFNRLPKRRLVVLGSPGAGKTVLAILLTLSLLEHRGSHGGPVPVLLSLSSWDPRSEHLDTWIIRRLVEDYPALTNDEVFGLKAAQRLVTQGHIVPVLDGLDEMPTGQRPTAIDSLDRVPPGRPLVVTCRSTEYEAAVAFSGGLLSTAAVVELEPVGLQEVMAFLPAGTVADDTRWAPVLTFLQEHPNAPLAAALSSPLMVTQARAIYSDPASDPAELLTRDRFANRASIEDHLLNAFIPAVYRHHPPPPTTDRTEAHTPQYPPELAQKWLVFLARHLDNRSTHDLVWWQLHDALAPRTRRVIGLLLELVTGLVAGLGLAVGVRLVVGVVAGLAGGFTAGLMAIPPSHPGHVNIQLRGRLGLFGKTLTLGLAVGLITGTGALLTVGPAAQLGIGFEGDLKTVLKVGFGAGLGVGIAFGVMDWLNAPMDAIRSPSPLVGLRDDRALSMLRFCMETLGAGLMTGLVAAAFELPFGVAWGLTAGLGGGFALGLAGRLMGRFQTGLAASAWGWFLLTRSWLALRGQLPWRLMRFLDDAHRRGVLRQAGAVYQFRHARLQDTLVTREPPPPPVG
ncbi:NACHT domain-containing protein [Streptomyces noboritoensis]|uniref:NACHT domain-containing protein n=1 Tax=Streptomyces noboritoensis TaxID=67337 RepID=A0ABV6TC63_9ACTN